MRGIGLSERKADRKNQGSSPSRNQPPSSSFPATYAFPRCRRVCCCWAHFHSRLWKTIFMSLHCGSLSKHGIGSELLVSRRDTRTTFFISLNNFGAKDNWNIVLQSTFSTYKEATHVILISYLYFLSKLAQQITLARSWRPAAVPYWKYQFPFESWRQTTLGQNST